MNTKADREEQLTLALLDEVGKKSRVSQRHLASHMGVALGLANSYLKRCIRKGFIKISEVPANRYLYYLTPKGFAEKSRLTAKYLSSSFAFYRKAGDSCTRVFHECAVRGWGRILLCGCSDLAEIASLRAQETNIVIVGTYDPDGDFPKFVGKPVWRTLEDAKPFDGCILTNLKVPAAAYEDLLKVIARDQVLVPDILRLG